MTSNGANTYVSTVATNGNDFYQSTANASVGSSYRVTGMYLGGPEDKQEIQRVIDLLQVHAYTYTSCIQSYIPGVKS